MGQRATGQFLKAQGPTGVVVSIAGWMVNPVVCARCMTFGGPRVDAAVARELLRAVEPMAIEAAFEAERMHRERQEDQRHLHDLEMQQARYEAGLAERRYAACDPDNRLIAAQLEKNWETALRRVRDLEARQPAERPFDVRVAPDAFANLRIICRRPGTHRM